MNFLRFYRDNIKVRFLMATYIFTLVISIPLLPIPKKFSQMLQLFGTPWELNLGCWFKLLGFYLASE